MSGTANSAGLSLADKINHLFRTVVPAGRGSYSTEEAAQAISARGVSISGSYIWLLRKGQRDNPTLRHLAALAEFFGVPPAYFFDDEVTEKVNTQLKLATALRDTRVRSLALRADGLSPASLDALLTMVNEARRIQNLPAGNDVPAHADRRATSTADPAEPKA
ncbi:helix-turn-helix domain-containing protein [Streptomyces halobius]|uniref:Helix-turn-helix domain-containing protein n=1 Tax=Streptomyces halobius TaxID=2879846 RepID=A0ABY4M7D5_9ACTN|nr:helix-turn-helix domain-containing protein [Streptomyces halobius]UQA92296.1 helix-turn-helix domain-containing protein [Streptomyces halobius]